MWPKFGNSSISMIEVVTTSILQGFDQNSCFFEGWPWFKFNNLGLIRCKLEITEEKLVGGLFASPPSWIGLKQNYLSRYFFRGNFFSQVLSAKVQKFLPVKIISIDVLFYRTIRQLKNIPKVTTFLIILWTKFLETIIINFHSIDYFFDSLIYSKSQDIIKVIVSEAIVWLYDSKFLNNDCQ